MEITGDKTFYTVTMARVYADQGRYEEAARIYRYLLDQTPDRADLRQALEAVISMLPDSPSHWHDVSDLIERWVRLMVRQNALQRLKKYPVQSADEASDLFDVQATGSTLPKKSFTPT